MLTTYFKQSLKRGCVQLVRRPVYLCMVVMAVLSCWFLMNLMSDGALQRVPVAIVDLDNSSLSRALCRNLGALQGVEVKTQFGSYHEALQAVQKGEINGFYLIPADLSERALGGRQPRISYYVNYAFYPPASMQFKAFKTVSVLANGKIVLTAISTIGLPASSASLQPVATHLHAIGNPYINYNYYLNLSFVPGLLVLIIMLVAVMTICEELKNSTSQSWLRDSGGSMGLALVGKLLPQTVLFVAAGWLLQSMMYAVYGFPLNCNPWHMLLAMVLLVIASQSFAVTACCIVPNFRYASVICTLMGILTFSFGGFSLPGEAMYSWVTAISYMMPMKYFFLISVDQALNGIPLYYSRIYYMALIAYVLLPMALKWRLKRECLNPVYVP